ncbi:ester cyclase [Streptomyces sp. CAU 1734]|uniref:ester cyclase n=1 Tax=Streptomyces sp. CAU 1734 TaxID=3140360 RepID=UPI003261D33A
MTDARPSLADHTAAPGAAAPPRRGSRESALELMERGWRLKDTTVLDEMAAPECTYHLAGHPPMGSAEFMELMGQIWRAKPDLRVETFEIIEDGDWVATRLRFSGTQSGELLGIPPTGRYVSIDEMVLERWDEHGKLLELHQEADFLGMLGSLGVVPPKDAGPLGIFAHTFTSAIRFTWLRRKARRSGSGSN